MVSVSTVFIRIGEPSRMEAPPCFLDLEIYNIWGMMFEIKDKLIQMLKICVILIKDTLDIYLPGYKLLFSQLYPYLPLQKY